MYQHKWTMPSSYKINNLYETKWKCGKCKSPFRLTLYYRCRTNYKQKSEIQRNTERLKMCIHPISSFCQQQQKKELDNSILFFSFLSPAQNIKKEKDLISYFVLIEEVT